ncbi:hypothetical protein PIB30_039395 [Stylosanthes scabra]|uniref:Fe2OG dioxygenase domain-containing protein n=1 Tax=Stylosanthes scabra TaxID=79078 RepID=A0ABU6ZD10_9FABA|nr:hypothetical protein [Stylosanthes scabra]
MINHDKFSIEERCEQLPLIDLSRLNNNNNNLEREECMKEITEASRRWGFFQVVNHGVSQETLKTLQFEQKKVFLQPFSNKSKENFLNLPLRCYRWGNPFATNMNQLSWSEAIHILLQDVTRMDHHHKNLSDTSFLTIVLQDKIGGLQLLKDGNNWVGVKPNPQALVVNIGDLFQALSNGVYKSAKHRVVASKKVDRFSIAYFYNPSLDALIHCHGTPPMYRYFTHREFRTQIEKDVKETGDKVGLSRFLL